MRSVILISPNNKEVESLLQQWAGSLLRQWKEDGTNTYIDSVSLFMIADSVRLSIGIDGERIYIDDCGTEADYEDGELADVDIRTPLFYLICYSDRDVMKYFIENSIFGEGSYMDNDHGRIIRVDELRKEEILDFIE